MNILTGQIFSHLTIRKPTNRRSKTKEIIWDCICECGNTCYYPASKLKAGKAKTCGKCSDLERRKRSRESQKRDRMNKGKVPFSQLSTKQQLFLINDFLFGLDYKELSVRYNVSQGTLRNGIRLYRERLNSAYELNYMANIQKTQVDNKAIEKALQVTFISDTLQDMLSADDTEVLTDHELMYCYIFTNTGSNEMALKESGLDICLTEATPIRVRYLGMFLREKPNIKQFIQVLQKEKIAALDASKERVQSELILQIEQLKELTALGGGITGTDRSNLLRAIELLGKSIGAFTDKLEIQEVKAANALDRLIEMAKQANTSDSGDDSEVWELPGADGSEPTGLLDRPSVPPSSEGMEQESVPEPDSGVH